MPRWCGSVKIFHEKGDQWRTSLSSRVVRYISVRSPLRTFLCGCEVRVFARASLSQKTYLNRWRKRCNEGTTPKGAHFPSMAITRNKYEFLQQICQESILIWDSVTLQGTNPCGYLSLTKSCSEVSLSGIVPGDSFEILILDEAEDFSRLISRTTWTGLFSTGFTHLLAWFKQNIAWIGLFLFSACFYEAAWYALNLLPELLMLPGRRFFTMTEIFTVQVLL